MQGGSSGNAAFVVVTVGVVGCGVDDPGRGVNAQLADQPVAMPLLPVFHLSVVEPECSTNLPGLVFVSPQNSAARLVALADEAGADFPSYTSRQSPESSSDIRSNVSVISLPSGAVIVLVHALAFL